MVSALTLWEVAEYISAAIVIGGVIGEYVSEFSITNQENKKQREKARRIGKLSTLVLAVGLVFELIALVNANVLAGREIELLRIKANRAEIALIELREKVKDRHITGWQRDAMTDVLASGPKEYVEVQCVGDNLEAYALANEIIEILTRSGWKSREVIISLYNPPPSGVVVREGSPTTPSATALMVAFGKAGVVSRRELTAQLHPGSIDIVVGSKPP